MDIQADFKRVQEFHTIILLLIPSNITEKFTLAETEGVIFPRACLKCEIWITQEEVPRFIDPSFSSNASKAASSTWT